MVNRDWANIKRYYASFNLDQFAVGLIGVFINLFFFATQNYAAVLYFEIATFIIAMVTYLLSSYVLRRYSPRYLYLIGLGLSILLLVDLLVATGAMANVLIFGIIDGASIGIFYAGNNVIMYDITKRSNRTSFVAINNLINGVVSLIAPVMAGVLIEFSAFSGVYRFFWDFLIAIVFFIVSAVLMLGIKQRGKFGVKYSIKSTLIKAGKSYSKFNVYFVVSQVFSFAFGIILPIYVFQITGNYLVTGVFASYEVLLYIAANFIFRRGFSETGRFARYSVPGIVASSLIMLFPSAIPPPINAFIFAGVYTFLSTPLDNRVSVEYMRFLDEHKSINRALFWANREYYLTIGRVAILASMILLLYYITNTLSFVLILPVLSLYSLIYYKIIGIGKKISLEEKIIGSK
jgi:MFS family permease